jgi:hypothetical protein
MRRRFGAASLMATVVLVMVSPGSLAAAEVIQGSPLLTVLPLDAIPALDRPTYVTVAEADRVMRPEEPVLGLSDGPHARAYSAWQLNHHEIVNDTLGSLPVAVTW